MKAQPVHVLDLFSGAGGMSLGFEAAGFRSVGAVEIDEAASDTWQRMFGCNGAAVFGGPQRGDITQLTTEQILERLPAKPDIIVGGPPCQGFSRIGRAKLRSLDPEGSQRHGVRDPARNELYRQYFRLVEAVEPLAFVVENVPGLRDIGGQDVARRIAHELAALGYNVSYFLLNAVHYGVPQVRWRLFIVGLHRQSLGVRAIPTPPPRTHRYALTSLEAIRRKEDSWFFMGEEIPEVELPRPAVTVGEALADLPRLRGHRGRGAEGGVPPVERRIPYRRGADGYASLMRSWPDRQAADDVSGNWYRWTPRDFETFAQMAAGDRYPEALRIAHARLQRHLDDLRCRGPVPAPETEEYEQLVARFVPPYRNDAFDDKWRKLDKGHPSWTVTAHLSKDAYSHIHYDSRQARTITIREAARLQSFPDAFEFSGNFGQQYRQIGNAVPPLLARALATNLRRQLEHFGAASLLTRATGT